MQWNVGALAVTQVVELETVGGTRFILPQASREEVRAIDWLYPHFADENGRLKLSIHSLVVETPTRRILSTRGSATTSRIATCRRGIFARGHSLRISPPPVIRPRASILCCARIFTSTTWAGIPCWSTDAGCRRFPRRAT